MTTLIRNVEVLDGTGARSKINDVLIKKDRILAIGNFPKKKADLIIDGRKSYLSPGFINVDTDSDHYLTLFTNPLQQDFLAQGVTTIIGGLCGASLAPLLYGNLETIRKWVNPETINVDWHSVEEFLEKLELRPLGVNFATLVGHATIRRSLIGETLRDLTTGELNIFKDILKKALEEGAFGLSTGLGYVHARQTPYVELEALASVVKEHEGVYATHLRNEEDGLLSSIEETMRLGENLNLKILINHLRPIVLHEDKWEESLDLIEKSGLDINIDIYPYDYSVIPVYTLLPLWAQNGGLELMMNHLSNSAIRERILKALPRFNSDEIIIINAPGNEYLVGKTLTEFMTTRSIKSASEGLLVLMDLVKLKAIILFKNINTEVLVRNLHRPSVWIASNSASFSDEVEVLKPERSLKTFPKFIELVLDKKLMPLELAIKKITQEPALKFGLEDRGVIREGASADLVIFSKDEIKQVILNGELVLNEGKLTQKLAGRVLRHTV